MHDLTIQYRRLGFNKTIKRKAPESWEECKNWHVLAVYFVTTRIDNRDLQKIMITKLLLKLPWHLFISLSPEYLAQLSQLFTWSLEKYTLQENKLPKIRSKYKWLYGPESGFNDVTGGEFVQMESYLKLLSDTGEEKYLDLLDCNYLP